MGRDACAGDDVGVVPVEAVRSCCWERDAVDEGSGTAAAGSEHNGVVEIRTLALVSLW